jgi:hypothetical protein
VGVGRSDCTKGQATRTAVSGGNNCVAEQQRTGSSLADGVRTPSVRSLGTIAPAHWRTILSRFPGMRRSGQECGRRQGTQTAGDSGHTGGGALAVSPHSSLASLCLFCPRASSLRLPVRLFFCSVPPSSLDRSGRPTQTRRGARGSEHTADRGLTPTCWCLLPPVPYGRSPVRLPLSPSASVRSAPSACGWSSASAPVARGDTMASSTGTGSHSSTLRVGTQMSRTQVQTGGAGSSSASSSVAPTASASSSSSSSSFASRLPHWATQQVVLGRGAGAFSVPRWSLVAGGAVVAGALLLAFRMLRSRRQQTRHTSVKQRNKHP